MTFQAALFHGFVDRFRSRQAVGKDHVAVQAHFSWFLPQQLRLAGKVRRVTTQASPLGYRLVLHFPSNRFCMTLLAQSLDRFRAQTLACLSAMRIVTFGTGLLLHGLVGKRAGLELVAKKTKIAPLPCSLEQMLRRVSIAVASGTAAGFQRAVEDRETGHIQMTATCRAIFRWSGRALLRVRLCSGQAYCKNRDQQNNHRGDYKTNSNFGAAGSQNTIPIESKRPLQEGSV